jgi:hypothetical protein
MSPKNEEGISISPPGGVKVKPGMVFEGRLCCNAKESIFRPAKICDR